MAAFEKLVDRLREEHPGVNLPDEMTFRRTYAGRVQKQAGAWSWYAVCGFTEVLGSQFPLSDLLKADELALTKRVNETAWEVDPA